MVGKPACGKTFVAQKIARYLNWIGVQTKVFSVAEHRREVLFDIEIHFGFFIKPKINKSINQSQKVLGFQLAEYYNPTNNEGVKSRDQIALGTLDTLLDYLTTQNGMVRVIFGNTYHFFNE